MTAHLSTETLSALADGELQARELAAVQDHLAGCAACTRNALAQSLLKSATVRSARRYAPPPQLIERLSRQAANPQAANSSSLGLSFRTPTLSSAVLGWGVAALLLVSLTTFVTRFMVERDTRQKSAMASADDGFISEVFDQHVAALAAAMPPQVLSSDNHTVKPWFQGKLPFAFNLPEALPSGIVLDGANLTYLHDQPAAQLLFSIGRHRVSVFVAEKTGNTALGKLPAEHSGFHVMSFSTGDIEMIAISDVNPTRLADLVRALEQAQNGTVQ